MSKSQVTVVVKIEYFSDQDYSISSNYDFKASEVFGLIPSMLGAAKAAQNIEEKTKATDPAAGNFHVPLSDDVCSIPPGVLAGPDAFTRVGSDQDDK